MDAKVKPAIDLLAETGGVCWFYLHRVGDNLGEANGLTIAEFTGFLDYLDSYKSQGLISITTPDVWYKRANGIDNH